MYRFLQVLNSLVWGVPALGLIVCTGLYLTVRTRFAQIRLLPRAFASFVFPSSDLRVKSKKRALCTALAATVGTGNLVGVAGAISLGGPGAVFWMWVCGVLGMITKFAEAILATVYRRRNPDGTYYGGPMYMILDTLKGKWHWLAYLYCVFGLAASFGVGNSTQINTVIGSVNSVLDAFSVSKSIWINVAIGIVVGILIYRILSKGVSGIGSVAERLVPVAAALYVIICVLALVLRRGQIAEAFKMILTGAFSPQAVTGGAVGSFFVSLRTGAARGVFTNEAGMGTASMAHATANVEHSVDQGMMGIVEVFIDTIVICTLTALVILCSGVPVAYGADAGISLTMAAFVDIYGEWVSIYLSLALCLFAFATVLGWGLYGMQCARFLFGDQSITSFVLLQVAMAMVSGVIRTETLWLFAQIVNGLMAIPNLVVLLHQVPRVSAEVLDFDRRMSVNDRDETAVFCP